MSDIIKLLKTKDKLRDLTAAEKRAGENVMRSCFEIKPNERAVIITDSGKLEEATVFFESAKKFTQNVKLVEMAPRSEHGQEPPEEIAKKMAQADALFLVTTKSLSHTKARREACAAGARCASMPGITLEMITRTLVLNYTEIAALSKDVAAVLTAGETARITSPQGTDITLSLAGRDALPDTGLMTNSGDFCNLPAGEAFIAPKEGTAKGVAVFDGCCADICLDEPIKITVEKGVAVKFEGGRAAKRLEAAVEKVGEKGRNIAELGVGTNREAKLNDKPNLLEVEKLYGTVHLALGNNAHFGGEVDVPFHHDGVILNPILEVDGKVILSGGKFDLTA